jgi:hypothetical protein
MNINQPLIVATLLLALMLIGLGLIFWFVPSLVPCVHTAGLNNTQIEKACNYSLDCTTC